MHYLPGKYNTVTSDDEGETNTQQLKVKGGSL